MAKAVVPKKPRKKISFLNFDGATEMSVSEIQSALKSFGVYVYEDPNAEDVCEFGIILSNVKLTNKELKKASDEYWVLD